MVEHRLKTLPVYWDATAEGRKNFEVRRDDRGFQKGDILVLMKLAEKVSSAKRFMGFDLPKEPETLRRRVTWILTGGQLGIEPGYVVMGLGDIGEES